MRVFLWLSLVFVTGCVLAIVGAVLLAIQDQPLVDRAATFTPENIERAKRIFERNDPRKLRSGDVRSIGIGQEDADLALNHLLQRYARGSSQVVLQQGTAHVVMTLRLPRNPIGGYLNVDATLAQGPGLPRIDALRIGRLPIPFGLGNWLFAKALARLAHDEDIRLAASMVKRVTFGEGHLTVLYQWQAGLPARLQVVAVPPEEQERLREHQTRLAETTRRIAASGGGVPLVDLMRPQFQFAAERSTSSDAVAENRAAILVLTLHATGQELAALVPNAVRWPRPVPRSVQLSGRDDFALHFLVSAAIASNAGTSLANAVGLYKEIEDSRGGSGFSFNDLAADGAGTRFGDLAVASPTAARKLQQRVASGIRESDIMPATEDLPEFMPEADFLRRFGGIGSPAYQKMTAEIDRRIAALPINR
jgi:hypothetical protein